MENFRVNFRGPGFCSRGGGCSRGLSMNFQGFAVIAAMLHGFCIIISGFSLTV